MLTLADKLITWPNANRYIIAYSGGMDSHALLSLAKAANATPLLAVHIHHGLSPQADSWAEHCRHICAEMGVPFELRHVDVTPQPGESSQAVARRERYHALADLMQKDDCLFTAHHQDDQAETVLLRLLRGAGVKGLAGIPVITPFATGYVARPLLGISREQLLDYAKAQGLKWINDPSNATLKYDRNYVRHAVMPHLKSRRPQLGNTLARAASLCAESAALLDELAALDLGQAAPDKILPVSQLTPLSGARQRNALRYWLQQSGFSMPSQAQLAQMQDQLLYAAIDATPKISWADADIYRYRGNIYAMPAQHPHDASVVLPWNLEKPLSLPGELGHLHCEQDAEQGIRMPHVDEPVTVRFRQGAERCQFTHSGQSQSLKKLFQEWGVPPWERARIPLVYYGEQLVAVPGYGQSVLCRDENQNVSFSVMASLSGSTQPGS